MSDCIFDIEEGDTVTPMIPVKDLGELKYQLMREFDIDMVESAAHALGVRTEWEARHALSMALQARKLAQSLEETREKMVKPHFDYQKEVNKIVQDFKDKCTSIEQHLQKKIETWIDSESDNPFTSVERLYVDDGSITTQKSYGFTITDESSVPNEFKYIDLKTIEKAIKYGIRNIPGIEIFEKKITILRINQLGAIIK